MSTLAETYAMQVGVTLEKPTIQESFYPLPHPIEKSILIHGFGGAIVNGNQATFAAKIFDYFSEVVALLKPVVEPLGYKLFQIGGPGEPGINGIDHLMGRTSILQCTYLVKHCALLIGNDSLWAHERGAFGGELVVVYGPTSEPHFPYWRNDPKTRLIESHRFGNRPSFASQENPKTINVIRPEQIANSALELLGQPPTTRNSYYIGPIYNQSIVEIVPNVVVDPRMQIGVPIIRMDLLHNEENLLKNLQLRKCSVIINREINLDALKPFKPNVASMRIEIDQISPEWIKKARRLGIQLAFMAVEKDEEKVKKMRLDYYDACQFDRFVPPTIEDFKKGVKDYTQKDLDPAVKLEDLTFRVNKVILSDGKVYLSRAHWAANVPNTSTDNTGKVIGSDLFFEEVAHYYIYQS